MRACAMCEEHLRAPAQLLIAMPTYALHARLTATAQVILMPPNPMAVDAPPWPWRRSHLQLALHATSRDRDLELARALALVTAPPLGIRPRRASDSATRY